LGMEVEGLAYGFMRTTNDFREGVEAFVEGRPPNYTGT
jgi:2-oxoglutaroyl-CoA hydrolase